jgi:hypothetical protein
MTKKKYFNFVFLLITCPLLYGQTIFGSENYIEYSTGTLPILISVPHGGNVVPSTIPNRTCNNPTTVTDANTIDLGMKIDSVFKAKTGCRPHLVYCHLRRTKLDANRSLADGACGNPIAENAWQEFHKFIDTARFVIHQKYGNKSFYFDLHGHGNPIQRIELGYLLRTGELMQNDDSLNLAKFISLSSIQNLARSNPLKLTHAQLLRGAHSFGSMLEKRSFPAVPSESTPNPGLNNGYFSGGYNTATHTCFNPMLEMNGVQVECNFQNVRNSESNRIAYAVAFVESVIEYMKMHFNLDLINCNAITDLASLESKNIYVYPTIIKSNDILKIYNSMVPVKVTWYDVYGKMIQQDLSSNQQILPPINLANGTYYLQLEEGVKNTMQRVILLK